MSTVTLTFLVLGSDILHIGVPTEITESEMIYEDIIYPLFLIDGYQLVQDNVPEDIRIYYYFWNGTHIELKDPPPEELFNLNIGEQ